jgi:hypothetical protein
MIALYFVLMSLRLAPVTTDAAMVARMELGQAVEDEGATPYEARWLAAVAYRESTYKLDAVGDHGSSFCAYQLHLPGGAKTGEGKTGEDLRKDARACTRQALKWLRWSLNACKSLPEAERIAGYARGRCESATGQRLSRDRWAQAQKAKLPGTAFAR